MLKDSPSVFVSNTVQTIFAKRAVLAIDGARAQIHLDAQHDVQFVAQQRRTSFRSERKSM